MAYLRGEPTVYCDGENRLHIWSKTGGENAWGLDKDDRGFENSGGVGLPMEVMDIYVVQRMAELIYHGLAESTIDRAIATQGNIGCMVLAENVAKIKTAFNQLCLHDPRDIDELFPG